MSINASEKHHVLPKKSLQIVSGDLNGFSLCYYRIIKAQNTKNSWRDFCEESSTIDSLLIPCLRQRDRSGKTGWA
jgi:hypothetical protein